jgi:hypothetical protein
MKTLALILLTISSSGMMLSCNKEKKDVEYHYKETWCANPWSINSSATEAEVKASVTAYLETEKVDIETITIEPNTSATVNCEACHCLSGNTIIVTIMEKYEEKIEALDFERHE